MKLWPRKYRLGIRTPRFVKRFGALTPGEAILLGALLVFLSQFVAR